MRLPWMLCIAIAFLSAAAYAGDCECSYPTQCSVPCERCAPRPCPAPCQQPCPPKHIWVKVPQPAPTQPRALEEEEQPEEEVQFAAPPRTGAVAGEAQSLGISGGAIHIPSMSLRMPTIELPSLRRFRTDAHMLLSAAEAPVVRNVRREYSMEAGPRVLRRVEEEPTRPKEGPPEQPTPKRDVERELCEMRKREQEMRCRMAQMEEYCRQMQAAPCQELCAPPCHQPVPQCQQGAPRCDDGASRYSFPNSSSSRRYAETLPLPPPLIEEPESNKNRAAAPAQIPAQPVKVRQAEQNLEPEEKNLLPDQSNMLRPSYQQYQAIQPASATQYRDQLQPSLYYPSAQPVQAYRVAYRAEPQAGQIVEINPPANAYQGRAHEGREASDANNRVPPHAVALPTRDDSGTLMPQRANARSLPSQAPSSSSANPERGNYQRLLQTLYPERSQADQAAPMPH